jgi:hypothetical protein
VDPDPDSMTLWIRIQNPDPQPCIKEMNSLQCQETDFVKNNGS